MVDKNLFRYDLAVAAILKNEGHYLKEWLDYHLLAGVDHFYLYDNDSTDNYAEIIAPYVEAGIVTSKKISGGSAQFAAYTFAMRDNRFACRYMAFIDLDEFIFPKATTDTITATLDGVLKNFPDASGLAINWQLYGSNNLETADYSRGVLERFTRRAPVDWVVPIPHRDIPGGNAQVKTVANPRRIFYFTSAHFPIYFAGNYSVNERGGRVDSYCNAPVTANKIAINHYNVKSREEFIGKLSKGRADKAGNYFSAEWFDIYDRNEIFDDAILRYRIARSENFALENNEQRLNRMFAALNKNLSAFASDVELDDKLETALTCVATAKYLRGKFPDDERLKIFEEASLAAVLKSLDGVNFSDAQLFLNELPNLLSLQYPVTNELRGAAMQIISRLMDFMRENELWRDYADLDNLRRLLNVWR
ncbi:MAG: glycosyltransferase family 92 protein [Selenomonadaceae bacterium]|nr:glycosyltransferase family 92 protein [Selenomonadaceae bacterium]